MSKLDNMQRIVEPELMEDKMQVAAYAVANFNKAYSLIIDAFDSSFPNAELEGRILDLGCGHGDISFRFANRFPGSIVLGIDGSAEMISLANKRKSHEIELSDRITFIKSIIPGITIPNGPYVAIVSNSLLHHLHQPRVLWETIIKYAGSGTKIFIADLFRPESKKHAMGIVEQCSAGEPDILKQDFYNSLLAAFTPKEIELQLVDSGLTGLKVKQISDLHQLVFGETS